MSASEMEAKYHFSLQREALGCEPCRGTGYVVGPRTCEACREVRKSIVEGYPTIDAPVVHAVPRERIVFAYATAGYAGDILQARKLTLGAVYTVAELIVYGSFPMVELVEFPGLPFNAVHFQKLEPDEAAT